MIPYPEENLLLRLLGGAPPIVVQPDQADATRFVELCRRHGVAAAARNAIDASGMPWPPGVREALTRLARKTLVDNMVLLQALHEAADALSEAGAEFVLLKGVSLVGFLYPEIDQRQMSDMDLLIREEAWPAVEDLLRRRGYRLPTPESEAALGADWYNHLLETPGNPPCSLEIHWNLESIERSRINAEELFRDAVPCAIEGRSYRRLCDDHLFLHLAIHLAHHHESPSLYWVEDLRRLLGRGSLDWDRIARTARDWGVWNALAYSLGYVERLYPDAVDGPARQFQLAGPRRLILRALGTRNPILPHRDLAGHPLRHAVSMALLDRWSRAAGYVARHAADRAARAFGRRPGSARPA